jgi:EPS-associated MarR family transcriptional regulator
MGMRLTDDVRYRIVRLIEHNPTISQRELALALGVSLGKTNFCIRALIEKGILKVQRFCTSRNKRAYVYVLTPQGVEDRFKLTMRYLQTKIREYDALEAEIAELRNQVRRFTDDDSWQQPSDTTLQADAG